MDAKAYKHFANRVRVERLRRGYSQRRLAELAGTSNGYICNVEASRFAPREAWMRRVATALGLNLEAMLP